MDKKWLIVIIPAVVLVVRVVWSWWKEQREIDKALEEYEHFLD